MPANPNPDRQGSDFKGIGSRQMKAVLWSGEELGAEFDVVDIPADLKAARRGDVKLVEALPKR